MYLTIDQTHQLLKIIEGNQAIVIGSELGSDFLTESDKQLLRLNGIDYNAIYKPLGGEGSSINLSFHFGMLAEAIGAFEANKLTYQSLRQYVREGNYIPVTQLQKATLNSIKMQSFSSLKTLNGTIFQDVNNIIDTHSLKGQMEFLAKEAREGIDKGLTTRQIANTISEKTGDWNRDFDRIIETANQTAFEQGKASEIERKNPGKDPLVYKRVFESACKHCIRLYLTNGIGSKPIIFKLSELRGNGSNIGRKVADWLATIDALHPYCRCQLFEVPEGFIWNTETQSFSSPDPDWKPTIINRKPILVIINGKEFWV